jgi:predicted nucleotidyltransferase component of viral defense system
MIPENFIIAWRQYAKWQTLAQIEQDLIISRALVDLYNDTHVKKSLLFRGGTALNKLFLSPGARYSEDIDFVQKRAEGVGATINAIRAVLKPWLGDPTWKITQRSAKLIYKYESTSRTPGKLKIEINTTEHFQVLPPKQVEFHINSEWFKGSADITTYEIDELMATKLRALYQRRKGRDLFDLFYSIKLGLINLENTIDIFRKYCANDGISISGAEFRKNLEQKKTHSDFHVDMHALLPEELHWNFEESYKFLLDKVISRIP